VAVFHSGKIHRINLHKISPKKIGYVAPYSFYGAPYVNFVEKSYGGFYGFFPQGFISEIKQSRCEVK
jgi:hypothetical protein